MPFFFLGSHVRGGEGGGVVISGILRYVDMLAHV